MKKRLLSLLLSLILVLSLLPVLPVFAADEYDLWIAGTQVTSSNASNPLNNGKFTYVPSEKTLHIKGDYQNSTADILILNQINGLKIHVDQDSQLKLTSSSATAGIKTFYNLEITGPGSLSVYVGSGCAVQALNAATVTLRDVTLDARGKWALKGNGATEMLSVSNSYVYAQGTNGAVLDFIGGILLDNDVIVSPNGGTINGGAILNTNGQVAGNVTIAQPYDLWLNGRQVTRANTSDPLGNDVFSYDAKENVLTVKGDFSTYANNVIETSIPDLTLYVAKDATLSSNKDVLLARKDLKITGPGKLTLTAGSMYAALCVFKNTTVTVENARLDASGNYGILGHGASANESLVIRSSYVHAKGNARAVDKFANITLDGCTITVPAGGKISDGKIVNADGTNAKEIQIEPVKYDLWVGGNQFTGTQVTSANAPDVLGNGVFSYVPEDNALLIKDSCTYANGPVICNGIPGLTVCTMEDVTLRCAADAIHAYADLTLTGPGKLTLTSNDSCGILVREGATLTILNADVTANGVWGIAGMMKGETLYVCNSNIHAAGPSGAICDFDGGIQLQDCNITVPAGGYVNGSAIVDSYPALAEEVVIVPSGEIAGGYDLWVAGTQVTTANEHDVLGDGAFRFVPQSSTLVVAGSCDAGGFDVISSSIPDLTVWIAEDVTATLYSDVPVITAHEDLTISGPGKLVAVSRGDAAIVADYATTITMEDADVDASGVCGLAGFVSGEKLVVKNSRVHAKGSDSAIVDFHGGITLEGCAITAPAGGKVQGTGIVDKDGNPAKEVAIAPEGFQYYDLWIAGVQVTSENAADVLGNGVFTFNPYACWLTVNGSCAKTDVSIINSGLPGLIVYAAKNATLSTNYYPIYSEKDIQITGPGKLTLKSTENSAVCLNFGATMWITDANVDAQGTFGIAGNPSGEKLIVDNSNVHATGGGAICLLDGIVLTDCGITKPEGGKIVKQGADGYAVVDKNGNLATEVTIEQVSSGKVNPFVDVKENAYYYDAVLWAVNHVPQITKGIDDTHFGPDKTCTRGQVVTFLWRAMGEPEPTLSNNPFTDVKSDQYYYKAVLWAVENKITTGTSPTTFSPDKGCTRGQVVTFLWRTEGEPAPASTLNPFTDVSSTAYYANAVLWAYHHTPQITNGTDAAHFSPDKTCTRGQIVTFLYRDLG